jgi:hypothetical protein
MPVPFPGEIDNLVRCKMVGSNSSTIKNANDIKSIKIQYYHKSIFFILLKH